MPDQFDLSPPSRRLSPRALAAAERRAAAKAQWDGRPATERDALWARVDRIIAEAVWYYAKSALYKDNPHSYCRRRDFRDDADFVFLVEFIRHSGAGTWERWPPTGPGGRYYSTLRRHHRILWTMGWPLNYSNGRWCTSIVNKKPVEPGDR